MYLSPRKVYDSIFAVQNIDVNVSKLHLSLSLSLSVGGGGGGWGVSLSLTVFSVLVSVCDVVFVCV